MNELQILNVTMEKYEHDQTVPMYLAINWNGNYHKVTIDHKDKDIQKTIRALLMLMLRNEIGGNQADVKFGKAMLERLEGWNSS